ncbi:hypothetical protein Bca4012_036488 [Brassica carinata]
MASSPEAQSSFRRNTAETLNLNPNMSPTLLFTGELHRDNSEISSGSILSPLATLEPRPSLPSFTAITTSPESFNRIASRSHPQSEARH